MKKSSVILSNQGSNLFLNLLKIDNLFTNSLLYVIMKKILQMKGFPI